MSESADKRKVSTDALETLGTCPLGDNEKRDAIHLAVMPVVAQSKLYPGQDVGADGTTANAVGIVDPFLKKPVMPKERFWLLIYPRQINSLRHVWSHPAIPEESVAIGKEPNKAESEAWLRAEARNFGISYLALLAAGEQCDRYNGLIIDGEDTSGLIPALMYDHLEVVLGIKIPLEQRGEYFSCSC